MNINCLIYLLVIYLKFIVFIKKYVQLIIISLPEMYITFLGIYLDEIL